MRLGWTDRQGNGQDRCDAADKETGVIALYTSFAEVYDQLMDNVNYEDWADFYAGLLQSGGVGPGSKVCECACGTGSLTLPLQKRGFQMTGVDLGREMLWQAAQKARARGDRSVLWIAERGLRKVRILSGVDGKIPDDGCGTVPLRRGRCG